MKPKMMLKMGIDLVMTVLLLCQMAEWPEEIDEHQWILYRLRSAGYAGLTTQKAAELYLEQYLPWAKEHREELAAFRKRKGNSILHGISALLPGFLVRFFCSGFLWRKI